MTTQLAPVTAPPRTEVENGVRGRHRARPISRAGWGWTVAFDLLLLLGGITILHLAVSGTIPSGGDGGNWLALAREWLGQEVMSAEVVYEPVFIGLLGSLLRFIGPIAALLVSALLAEATLIVAAYAVVRPAGRVPAIASAALVGLAGYRLEAYAWGAYPQILAIGFGLLTVWVAIWFIRAGGWAKLAAAVIGALVVLSTHKLVGGLLVMAVPAAAIHTLWLERFRREIWKGVGLVVGAISGIGAFFLVSWFGSASAGVEPTLNALGLTRGEQLLFSIQEASIPWMLAGILALIGFGLRSWGSGAGSTVSTSFGWVAASTVGFLALGEPRALIQAQIAVLPVAVLVVWRWWATRRGAFGWRRVGVVVLGLASVALFGSLILTGQHRYDLAADWYRVAGQSQLEALSALQEVAEPGDLVVASRGPNGNPVGWSVEGYAGIPTYTSIDTAYLAFPEEREQAEEAEAVFSTTPEQAAAMLQDIGARFLILDRRGPDVGWLGRGEPAGLTSLSDGTLLVMEVSDGP